MEVSYGGKWIRERCVFFHNGDDLGNRAGFCQLTINTTCDGGAFDLTSAIQTPAAFTKGKPP